MEIPSHLSGLNLVRSCFKCSLKAFCWEKTDLLKCHLTWINCHSFSAASWGLSHFKAFKSNVMINTCMPSRCVFGSLYKSNNYFFFGNTLTVEILTYRCSSQCDGNQTFFYTVIRQVGTHQNEFTYLQWSSFEKHINQIYQCCCQSQPPKQKKMHLLTRFCPLCWKKLCRNPNILENRAVDAAYK